MIDLEILILKEINYGENDKILHALTKSMGKIQLLSKGCRKNNSHLINISQLFAYSKCSLVKSKNMYIITSGELINNFYNLRNNIEAFFYGNYILELLSYISQDYYVENKIFDMTISYLKYLCKLKTNLNLLTAAFELKLVSMLGYKPNFRHCLQCNSLIEQDATFLIEEGGFYCTKCLNSKNHVINVKGINVTYSEILTMERILKTKFQDISTMESNGKIISIIRRYLFYYIGKDNFTSLKLL